MNNTLKINKTRLNNYTISDVKNWIPCSKIKHAKNMQKLDYLPSSLKILRKLIKKQLPVCSENLCNIHMKKRMLEFLFSKVEGLTSSFNNNFF